MDASLQERIEALQSTDVPTRLLAAQALSRNTVPNAAAVLVRAMADSDDDVRQWVTEALENLGPPPQAQLGELIALSRSENDDVMYWAVTLIGRLGRDATDAKSVLKELAKGGRSPAITNRARAALASMSWKRFTIRQLIGWTFVIAAFLAYVQRSDPRPAAREYCIREGWKDEDLVLAKWVDAGLGPIRRRSEIVYRLGDQDKWIRVKLWQPVFFFPWRVVECTEESRPV